jgi:hypothetical protein
MYGVGSMIVQWRLAGSAAVDGARKRPCVRWALGAPPRVRAPRGSGGIRCGPAAGSTARSLGVTWPWPHAVRGKSCVPGLLEPCCVRVQVACDKKKFTGWWRAAPTADRRADGWRCCVSGTFGLPLARPWRWWACGLYENVKGALQPSRAGGPAPVTARRHSGHSHTCLEPVTCTGVLLIRRREDFAHMPSSKPVDACSSSPWLPRSSCITVAGCGVRGAGCGVRGTSHLLLRELGARQ